MKRYVSIVLLATLIVACLSATGCVVAPARGYYAPAAVWVPGHWVPTYSGSIWVRGHWR